MLVGERVEVACYYHRQRHGRAAPVAHQGSLELRRRGDLSLGHGLPIAQRHLEMRRAEGDALARGEVPRDR